MLSGTKASILCFPQKFTGNSISLHILFVPREDPLIPFTTELIPGTPVAAFAKAKLKFAAKLIPSLELLPSPSTVVDSVDLLSDFPDDPEPVFQALKNNFNITITANELKPLPKNSTFIRKYLPKSYRNAFDFTHPRSPRFGEVDDEYLCAMKKESAPGTKDFNNDELSWGKVYAMLLRQPELCKRLGMLYKTTVPLPQADYFKNGGWIYIDLASGSDYFGNAAADKVLIKKYAARLPKLSVERTLFAPIQFFVTDDVQAGNFDVLFKEAADFDDGFTNIVHCMQPQKSNPVLEADQDGLPPVSDFGIRIGWEDEQLLEWLNRLLRRPDHSGASAEPIVDAPVGVLNYRIDVKDADDPAAKWHSLNKVAGELSIAGVDLGQFSGEFGVEVAPTQLDGYKEGLFWLPAYFSQWDGTSVVLKEDRAMKLYGMGSATPRPVNPVGLDQVELLYGKTYRFRVRMADMTGGGPTEKDNPLHSIPSQHAACRFRRYLPPAGVKVHPLQNTYKIYRPLLGYPALLFTGLDNALDLLEADLPVAKKDKREPGYPDPDVMTLRIEVAVKGLGAQTFYPLFTTIRDFPSVLSEPVNLGLSFVDARVIKFNDPATLGDLPATPATGNLILPTARDIRITVTPVCKEDPLAEYFGSEGVRYGRPTELFTRADSKDESGLFTMDAGNPGKHLKGIMLQPDEKLMSRLAAAIDLETNGLTLFGKPGQRVVFGCCREVNHLLSPENGSISFSSQADLVKQWIVVVILELNRDWSWNALHDKSFRIKRNGVEAGTIDLLRTASSVALQEADRGKTTLVFIDAVDPKPKNDDFPRPLRLKYEIEPNLVHSPVIAPPEKPELEIHLPVAVIPAQLPKVLSAGIALSHYTRDHDGYAWSRTRQKMLWLEFEEPVRDPVDNYFVYVKAYAPDPMLVNSGEDVGEIGETSAYIDPELIRVITPGHSDDRAGLNAMQQMIPCAHPDRENPRHFLLPLPTGMTGDAPELFGFFTYEICVGHKDTWSTAQGRFGRTIRLSGVQHPAPALVCSVSRNDQGVSVTAPYARAVLEGKELTTGYATEAWALLYAQVKTVDNKDHRNILLSRKRMGIGHSDFMYLQHVGIADWINNEIIDSLGQYGIDKNAPLSCMVIELLPNTERDSDPLGGDLGYTRIYRTSQLEPVPEVCCVNC